MDWYNLFYQVNTFSITLRLVLAMVAGGIIGLERGASKRPAGFRTHILVCVGAAMVMMTSQFIVEVLGIYTDVARLGAQVITGVGFLGAGTILLTGQNHIRGLTTAAALWASACVGLAFGIGFYQGALIVTLLIFISLTMLPKVEHALHRRSRIHIIYIEVNNVGIYKNVVHKIQEYEFEIHSLDFDRTNTLTEGCIGVQVVFRVPRNMDTTALVQIIKDMEGVSYVAEL